MIFYGGISEVVHKNPDICEGCLELMNGHVVELFGSVGSDDTRINLELSKTITEKVRFNCNLLWGGADLFPLPHQHNQFYLKELIYIIWCKILICF